MLNLDSEQMLHRLYHQDPLRLFEPSAVRFQCNCSRERTFNALTSLPPLDLEELLEELGSITMDCEFCNLAKAERFVRTAYGWRHLCPRCGMHFEASEDELSETHLEGESDGT